MDTARNCPTCGTSVPAGKSVCQHCEQPIDPAPGQRPGVYYNPAGLALPSPIQGHATVLVAVALAIGLLGFLAFNALQGIGPFTATVVDQARTGPGGPVTVTLEVTNEGSRAGAARCHVTGRSGDGELISSQVTQSPSVRPRGSARFDVTLGAIRQGSPLEVRCS
jgi:hypothetical protein